MTTFLVQATVLFEVEADKIEECFVNARVTKILNGKNGKNE